MSKIRLALATTLIAALPLTALADITVGDLPDDSVWYLHANLEAIRASDAGSKVYRWFEDEVIVDVKEEIGIDLSTEVDSITAFANDGSGIVIVIDGSMTKDTQDKIMALATAQGPVHPREHKGRDYFLFGDGGDPDDDDDPMESLEDSAFVSFAIDGKAIVTSGDGQMQSLLDNEGRITGMGSHDGALLVLSANRNLVQAGMQPDGIVDDGEDDWESNIMRNTEQAALLVADESGLLAIEAQLMSTDPKMAAAIGGIVNGLIQLQVFNSELPPEVQDFIRNTKVEIRENLLSISTVLDAEVLVAVLDD